MASHPLIAARVKPETKARFHALAQQHQLTDTALLKRFVEMALLQSAGLSEAQATDPVEPVARDARVYVRLPPEDRLLLKERARSRGMAAATYVSVLLRAHLRNLVPLPKDELLALHRSIVEVKAIGRNLNQLARAANLGGRVVGPSHEDLRALLRTCEGLHAHFKGLLQANLRAWDTGYVETHR